MFFTVGSNNANVGECISLRNKSDCVISSSGTRCSELYNRSSLLPDTALFKHSHYPDGVTSTHNVREPLTNRRLLTTSSADQVFGSLKSLSNTEVNSQASALSSASCSSASSLLSSSNCGLTQGKEVTPNILGNIQNQQQGIHSMDIPSPNHSPKVSIQKSPEKTCSINPPPIPPKISSNQNQLNLGDTSLPVLTTSSPAIKSNDLPNIEPSKLAADSNKGKSVIEHTESLLEEITSSFNKLVQENDEDASNNDEDLSQRLENNRTNELFDIDEQVMNTQSIVKTVMYIDEDDLGASAALNPNSR